MSGGGNIKVVVRCRPLNSREIARGAKSLIRMEGNRTILDPPEVQTTSARAVEKKSQVFSFDKSYWSASSKDDPRYASQQTLFDDLGVELLNHSFEGFNTCIFAYGQTGSGKSYSMMGYGRDKGIIPLSTSELFRRVEQQASHDPNLTYTVEVSYIEIYNEKVRDLLNPKNKGNLKVREHPSLGPYVEDLSKLVVENDAQMMTLMDEGNKACEDSCLTQKRRDPQRKMVGEKVSKISLVDLAGSERQASTGATGTRLKEGANINKSLTTLGKVIAALANASEGKGRKKKEEFVPYRDSVLTWLLKESLGGNSKTAMIAAISPADYDETLSTLRYADAAKRIRTHAVVNEDPNAKLIRELKEELELLRGKVSSVSAGGISEDTYDPSIPPENQIVTYQTKNGEIKRMTATQAIHVAREKALEELGITVDKDMVGVHAPQKFPSLVNLNEDPLMSECLVYQLKPGTTVVGNRESTSTQIKLSGEHITANHCRFINTEGHVTLEACEDARTFVNGKRVPPETPVKLQHGFRVILGDFHVFRFNDPAGVRAHRTRMSGMWGNAMNGDPGTPGRSDSPAPTELMDWTAARREAADIEALGDRDLDKLFDDIVKVRTLRGRPDSRLDLTVDIESRLLANSIADESVDNNPWEGQLGNGSPLPQENGSVSRDHVTDGSESTTRSETSPAARFSVMSGLSDESLEQLFMTKQLQTLALEVKRIRAQAAVSRARGEALPEAEEWTMPQTVLVRKAVEKWKQLRNFVMAEQLLHLAADVREANIIARQMARKITYNFTIMDGPAVSARSALDDLGGIIEFDDVADPSESSGARVMIKVIDHESTSVYTWNTSRFQQQLARMRQVLAVKDKPNYSVHLSVRAPFADRPTPSFSYIGGTYVPLRLLAHQLSYVVTVPIFCAYTMEAIGSCRVEFKCSSIPRSGVATPDSTGPVIRGQSFSNHKFGFTVTVDLVKGLTSADFSEVHAQTRLSSLVGPIASEDTFASLPVKLDEVSAGHLQLRRTLSVLVTSDLVSHLQTGFATIEFFARVRNSYLERLERFDAAKEISDVPNGETTPESKIIAMRQADTKLTSTEHHDVLASIEVHEMGNDGEYKPADVEDDVVQLHLGVQRQMVVSLKHASGQAFKWTRIAHASASHVRVQTKEHTPVEVPASSVLLQLVSHVEYSSDGTSLLLARGTWDTAAHHCIHLDRRTRGDDLTIVRVTFMVDVERLDEPTVFTMDIKLKVIGRDSRRSSISIRNIWRPRPVSSVVGIFGVDLNPPLARTACDLWRLDTSKKPVANEAVLGGWRPRSIALVREYGDLARLRRTLAEVQITRVVLEHVGDIAPSRSDETVQRALEAKSLSLWKREMDTRIEFDVKRETPVEKELAQRLRELVPDIEPRLVPTVRLIPPNESIVKRGTLALLKDSRTNRWEEANAVLRPPYLHLHPEPNKRETQVINLSQASVVASPDVETLLGRRYAFTVYTPTNSYIIQAASQHELDQWCTVIGRQRRGG
ncbi:hypothetical protein CspeluHIS016_0112300 [Cutaneotrichosporon spelunceum]|uniref:Kinesin-domain-containing protein n=1 Tax=Cutaneotrichosporon spelunceum TaxID=1672016 RepID=A0AAD3TQ37_9TREE|nr:hypothetical protein CspeluHIS016_0112300 [Cutaneotrichosporon spelunceum]